MLPAANPMWRPDRTQEASFLICGERLIFRSNDPRIIQVAHSSFEEDPAGADPGERPLEIELFDKAHVEGGLPFDPLKPTSPVFHNRGYLFSITVDQANHAVVNMVDGFGFGVVSQDMIVHPEYMRSFFVEAMALSMLGPARGMLPIHASCIVIRDRAVLLYGESGTGKSTLALTCVQRGAQFLADDVVHLSDRGAGVHAFGLPYRARLTSETTARFPGAAAASTPVFLNGSWKQDVDLRRAYPGKARASAELAALIFLTPAPGGNAELRPLSEEQARHRFRITWPYDLAPPEGAQACLQQALRAGAFELAVSDDPEQAAALLDGPLDGPGRRRK